MHKALGALIVVAALLAAGCGRGGETIWSTEAKSPDGLWVATGRADRHSGPGNASIVTGVYLQRTNGYGDPEAVLSFFNDLPPDRGGINLKVDWLTPTHLQVTFNRHPDLDFQVVKYAGLEISIRDAPNVAEESQSPGT